MVTLNRNSIRNTGSGVVSFRGYGENKIERTRFETFKHQTPQQTPKGGSLRKKLEIEHESAKMDFALERELDA